MVPSGDGNTPTLIVTTVTPTVLPLKNSCGRLPEPSEVASSWALDRRPKMLTKEAYQAPQGTSLQTPTKYEYHHNYT